MLALLKQGEEVISIDPSWPAYREFVDFAGGKIKILQTTIEERWTPNLRKLEEMIGQHTKVIILNYPNNPTGAVLPEGLFERAVEFGREHDVLIVHDASYTETTYDGYVAPSFLETPGAKDVGVEVFSLSKGWNMTGWRTAAIVGNADAVSTYWKLKTNIDSGQFEAVQLATVRALEDGPPAEMPALYQRRRDLVCDALREIGVDVTPPKGTIYVWAPVPDGHTSASYCELVLEESGVVVSPGGAYGPNGEGFFRISLTIDDARLSEAVERLRGSLGG